MGQIFNRLKDISSSYFNEEKFNEDKFIESNFVFDEDEELKKIIDNLDSNSQKNNKSFSDENFRSNVNMNYYNILGVSFASSKEEVSLAYKTLIKQYHPDKVANLGKEFQELAILKTKEINFAYQKIKEERKW